jgi:uncharacterized protein (DUF1800 family)
MPRALAPAHAPRTALLATILLAACGGPRPLAVPAPSAARRSLTAEQQAAHVLNRLAFGPGPGDVERVARAGVDRWIDQQLHPEAIPDTALDTLLASLAVWNKSAQTLASLMPPKDLLMAALKEERGMAPAAPFAMTAADSALLKAIVARTPALDAEVPAQRVLRAQLSERQLVEVMTDFWENHFSVFTGKMPTKFALLEYDRDVIRPRALGKFRDLLGAVAHSPAMLYYLDNWLSVADTQRLTLPEWGLRKATGLAPPKKKRAGLNENYGRELLELHTLGVDGGYTQHDVVDVARALTGWGMQFGTNGPFSFRPEMHDAEPKEVLGHELAPGRGQEDGEDVLDLLARHPATARFIATKLARRFVSDTPGRPLIERAASTFRRTDGDIGAVVRTIVTSPEFFSRAAYRAKVKTPFELVVSARRILNAQPDTTPQSAQAMARLKQPLWGRQAPNGWPETGDQWITAGSLLDRINFGVQLGTGKALPGAALERWPWWNELSQAPFERQVDGVVAHLLGGNAPKETRRALLEGAGARPSLAALIGLALGSPEFQRR